ncbi:hypothetical protein [Bradyrhizobium canariense]|uniref:Uncharacterized protein n=1 Tax=Bradyrhizobium canariense TaxID=255045 RepID=A0A1H1ZVG8_9BRAD|nr:hypothetical protein [Bradyrhizobium canariense]SDT37724.1 hypothetical protein SAMN05444158_5700 [Bradyrhizobium canariense]
MKSVAHAVSGDRILDPMIDLARCTKQDRIVIAGSKAIELMLELQRRGFLEVAATANCGRAAGQYDVAMVDWRRRTTNSLEPTIEWLLHYLRPGGMLIVWVDPQKQTANLKLRSALERLGCVIESGTVHDCGCGLAARLLETNPLKKAA